MLERGELGSGNLCFVRSDLIVLSCNFKHHLHVLCLTTTAHHTVVLLFHSNPIIVYLL